MSCSQCFSGSVQQGTPKGNVVKLHGLDVYVSEPEEGKPVKGIIIIIPDAFGWEFPNNRFLADHYAEKGSYKVYLPEFMNGNAAPHWVPGMLSSLFEGGGLWTWLAKPYQVAWLIYGMIPFVARNTFGKSWPIVKDFFTAVRENEGAHLPIGAAGFCWGGKHTLNLAQGYESNGKPLIDAGFTAHPSNLEIPAEIEKIKKPVSFAIGDKDIQVRPPHIEQIRQIVEAKPEGERGEVKTYYGAGHGFAVRADHILKEAKQQADEAEDQAIDWFNRHFQGLSY
ncbi:hypothetical protein Plec18167_005909 [Paecilomyces lecythidis]|uniref:Dienelactone hydrolase domain-containing protein n=1 Tax=Paecilomyces lecythidis TaxID=3004212 RepID=A0ABR3XG54_9EURO